MRTLIGGVGYPNLRDHSAALQIISRLSAGDLGADAVVEDTSYNPIAVVQWLESEPPEARFGRAIFITAVERGRPGGSVTAYRWDGALPPDELIHQAITEAVTGIIAMENTVAIAGYFKVLPPQVAIVEIEPVDHAFGEPLSDAVSAAVAPACALVASLARDDAAFAALPIRPLPARQLLRAGGL